MCFPIRVISGITVLSHRYCNLSQWLILSGGEGGGCLCVCLTAAVLMSKRSAERLTWNTAFAAAYIILLMKRTCQESRGTFK